jgi:peroxiredoxin Q/BCP
VDGVQDQKAFADKFQLPFTLLADTDKSLARDYGVLGASGMASRATFLIDKTGTIRKVWPKVSPGGHPAEVIKALKSL